MIKRAKATRITFFGIQGCRNFRFICGDGTFKYIPQEKKQRPLEAIKSNSKTIKHALSQRVRLQLRKVPNLAFLYR
jgi:hypothetical protein